MNISQMELLFVAKSCLLQRIGKKWNFGLYSFAPPGRMIYCRIIILTSILCIAVLSGASQERSYEIPDYRGETLHYKLKYGIFRIGSASISFQEDPSECGFRIVVEAQSDGLMKIFKNLHYLLVSCMDPATGLPNSTTINFKDRKNISFNELVFDHNSRSDSTIVFSHMSGKHIVPNNMHDILTAFYHFRRNHINDHTEVGTDVVIATFHPDKLWDQRITYDGEESIKTADGQLECQKYIPSTVVGKYFRNPDDMSVWYTKDESHIPVKIRLNMKIGVIHGELVNPP